MKYLSKLAGCCLLLSLVITGSIQAQETSPADPLKSCRDFLQGFYNKFVQANNSRRPTKFSYEQYLGPELRRRLKEDRDAQEKDASGEIVGLDFDPIAAGNDIYTRYEVGAVTPKGERYWVEVYGYWEKKRDRDQKIIYELMSTGGRWMIMNIRYYHYQNGKLVSQHDLLTTLKELREERRKKSG